MPVEWVVDASVLGAAFFREPLAEAADRFLSENQLLLAPDLLTLEMASIAAKKVWRGEATDLVAAHAVQATVRLVPAPVSGAELAVRAYALAAARRISAYDAAYLALAELRACRVATRDARLARAAEQAGLGRLVHPVA